MSEISYPFPQVIIFSALEAKLETFVGDCRSTSSRKVRDREAGLVVNIHPKGGFWETLITFFVVIIEH